MLNNKIQSPLEQFEINNFIPIDIFYLNLSFSNIAFYMILTLSLSLIFNTLLINNNKIILNKWSLAQESLYWTIYSMVIGQIGKKGEIYFPLIYGLFIYILISNLLGNIPYSFAITSHLVFTIGLSITIFIGVTILGLYKHKLEFFSLMCPLGTPLLLLPILVLIETVSYLARAISLGLRLGANIMAGHMLLIILAGFLYNILTSSILFFFIGLIPFILVIGIATLELAISAIQSYVFVILTCSYIKDSLDLH